MLHMQGDFLHISSFLSHKIQFHIRQCVCRSDPREAKAQFQIRFSALALYDVNKRGNPQQGDLSNTAQAVSTKSPPTDVLPH